MADTKISALTDGATAAATDRVPIARSPFGAGDNRYITPAYIRTYILGLASAFSANGAVSAPALTGTGTWYSGGTATTTKPMWLLEPTGTTSTGWSTSGTGIGVNAATGFTGNLLDLQVNGVSSCRVVAGGKMFFTGTDNIHGSGSRIDLNLNTTSYLSVLTTGVYILNAPLRIDTDVLLYRDAANTLALRNSANAQTFRNYGTYTDASNYRRIALSMSTAGVATLQAEGAGTGASGNVLHISSLPTSNPGPGILWNNAGTPAIGT